MSQNRPPMTHSRLRDTSLFTVFLLSLLFNSLLFNDKRSDIRTGRRHGHGTEDAVAFPSCDNADIIPGVLLELGPSVLSDHRTGGVRFCSSGLVPVPGSVGIRCDENIVSVAAVDDVPADIHLQVVP